MTHRIYVEQVFIGGSGSGEISLNEKGVVDLIVSNLYKNIWAKNK